MKTTSSCPYKINSEDFPSYGVGEESGGSFSRVWASIPSLFAALLAHSSYLIHYYSHARIRRQQNKEKNTNTMINKSSVETHAFLDIVSDSPRFLSRLFAAKEKRL